VSEQIVSSVGNMLSSSKTKYLKKTRTDLKLKIKKKKKIKSNLNK